MIFLPIVERELRVGARRHSTYAVRLAVALIAIVIGIFFYLGNLRAPRQTLAQRTFQGLSLLALCYSLGAGRQLTADCISSEKRDGTLGLLFLTDLKGYDIVIGKLAATSVTSLYSLLAVFPVLAIPLLLGGVTNGEFWRMILVLVNTFLFSLAVGLVASAISRDARRAYGANFLLLLLLGAGPAACAGALLYFPLRVFVPQLMYSCPAYAYYLSSDARYATQSDHFWGSVLVVHALTWLLLALASRIAPRAWRDRPLPAGTEKPGWRERWQRWLYGDTQQRAALRKRLLASNPILWLASRIRIKPAGVWIFLAFATGWWLFVWLKLSIAAFEQSFGFATVLLLNSALKLWIAVEAGQRLAEEQKAGSLELLLSTPLTVGDILRGQLLALRRQFLWPLLLIIGVELVLIFGMAHYDLRERAMVFAFGKAGLIMLVMDVVALIWVAMSSALTSRNPNMATLRTIGLVLFLPWTLYLAITVLIQLLWPTVGGARPGWKFYLNLWFWLGILTDIGFGLPAALMLLARFRDLALRRAVGLGVR